METRPVHLKPIIFTVYKINEFFKEPAKNLWKNCEKLQIFHTVLIIIFLVLSRHDHDSTAGHTITTSTSTVLPYCAIW